jgi:hypothetical protein
LGDPRVEGSLVELPNSVEEAWSWGHRRLRETGRGGVASGLEGERTWCGSAPESQPARLPDGRVKCCLAQTPFATRTLGPARKTGKLRTARSLPDRSEILPKASSQAAGGPANWAGFAPDVLTGPSRMPRRRPRVFGGA